MKHSISMEPLFRMVHTFNRVFKARTFDSTPPEEHAKLVEFRDRLIQEEYDELLAAARENNTVEIVDALMDLLYVIIGAIDTLGPVAYRVPRRRYGGDVNNFRTGDLLELDIFIDDGIYHDQLEIVVEWCTKLSVPIQRAFTLVHESNMSKICNSREEADQTAAKCAFETYIETVPLDSGVVGWVVYRKSDNKVCKSINYSPVDLRAIPINWPAAPTTRSPKAF